MTFINDDEFGKLGIVEPDERPATPNPDTIAKARAFFEAAGIDYEITPDGRILANAEQMAYTQAFLISESGGFPWFHWEAGRRWTIRRGIHFAPAVKTMQEMLWHRARKQGLKCKAEILDDQTIRFRFTPKEASAA